MFVRVHSFLLAGIDARPCDVEVDFDPRDEDKVTMLGLAQAAVRESADRVRRAIGNAGFRPAAGRVLIHLAPADVKKEAAALDLPISVALLRCTGEITGDEYRHYLVAGELALDGQVRRIRGALSMAMLAAERGMKGVIVPIENAREARVVDGIEVVPVGSLGQAVAFLNGTDPAGEDGIGDGPADATPADAPDFADVKGQESVKRAVTVACAGGHNLLMVGPPGTGKSMLARRMGGILPPLSRREALETTRIYSATGLLPAGVSLLRHRPVRTPHHSATAQALVGGGSVPRPGECSLAHNGILFLDELPEFGRNVLENLREPLEAKEITVSRVHGSTRFPADFMLVAAMNPTQSGHDVSRNGKTNGKYKDKYLDKLSGPLLDRIDLHVEVPAVGYHEMAGRRPGTGSAEMRERVSAARSRQLHRFGDAAVTNGRMDSRLLARHVTLEGSAQLVLKQAMEELGLSARAYDKVRRVARTIADVEDSDAVTELHVAEAVQYRLLDRRL